jgi:hypothetical protein
LQVPRCNLLGDSGDRPSHYIREERPFAGSRPPAALFFYSPDRKGAHPQAHLKRFRGVIHADGYAGAVSGAQSSS